MMFDFDGPEDGSADRFAEDQKVWEDHPAGKIKHLGWWLIHNVIAHPLIGVLPVHFALQFHDYTSRQMHRAPGMKEDDHGE